MAVNGVNGKQNMKSGGLDYFIKQDSNPNKAQREAFFKKALQHFTQMSFQRRDALVPKKNKTSNQA